MSAGTLALHGLLRDSALQVLDNKVFRVLLGLAALPILITFVIGIHESSFSILFGLYEIDYPEWISMLGDDPRSALLEIFIEAVIDSLAGGVGITVCVAATAFFVPLMLEKGSADLIFTKPISRSGLFLSRYFTGLFFIAGLGSFLTTGMYLGVLTSSGLSYPAILWSTLTLIYIFALIHGVTMLIGVFTKSTPAAMILGIMFFFSNGCVHNSWQLIDAFNSDETPLAEMLNSETDKDSSWGVIKNGAIGALNVAHYVLPKTSDAPLVVIRTQDALFDTGRADRRKNLSNAFSEHGDQTSDSDPDTWFENHFAWDAPELRYNTWFSVLSSAIFTLVVLGAGCWRIRRMDF